jgi:AraC-like DNA-binding protein
MIYQSIQPSFYLKDYIREYLLLHFVLNENATVPIKPYPAIPEQGITLYVRGFILCSDPENNSIEKRPGTVIFGQPVARQNLQPSADYCMFNIRFQPGALYQLLKIPMNELVHKNIDAEAVLGKEIRELNERLGDNLSYPDMVKTVEAFLWKKFQQTRIDEHPSVVIPRLILGDPSSFNLDKMASLACLSASQFERTFIRQIGITPKFFARMCRFQQAYELKEKNRNWIG